MGKAKPSHLMSTSTSPRSRENAELDKLSPNYNKFGNSTNKVYDRLIYFHACCNFYYKCKFSQVLHGEWRKTAKVTNMRNIFDGGIKYAY